ncbi:36707_t:CDS:2, partial [Gigaspora margarita]
NRKAIKRNKEFSKQDNQQRRKTMLLDSEVGHFDYGIKEQLDQETPSEQMVVDIETIKVNLSKTLMELDGYGSQNENKKEDYILKRSKTTFLRIQELPKLLSSYKKENYIVNSTLMKIDPNKVSSKINMKINPIQKEEKGIVTGSNAIKIVNRRSFSSLGNNAHSEEIKLIKNPFEKRKSVEIFKNFDPSEAIEQSVLDKIWNSFMNGIIFAINKNISKKRIRNTPNNKKSKMKEKKSLLHRSVVEINKIVREINKYKTKIPEQVKYTK